MEFKHFSHNHGLDFHQMPQGSKGQCSGCKSPVSGNIYACWQCNHFLHEQCYHATRSLRHPSHPSHPLTLVQNPTYQSGSFLCQSCKLIGNGLSYACAECQFDMHVQCALSQTQNQHVSPFSVSNTTSNSNPQPQNLAYPQSNTQNFTQQPYNAHPQNHMYSHNAPSFIARPQNSTHSIFPGIGGSTNPNGQLHFQQPNSPMPNYSHNVSPPYTNPPIQPTTTPTYNTGINPIATTTSNPPPLPPPFYNPTNQAPRSGGLTNQNNPFPPPYHQLNTTIPNYSPHTSNPYTNHPTPPSEGIPTRDNMVNPTTNTVTNPPPQPFYHSTALAQETNTPESNPSSVIKHFSHPHVLKQIELDATTGKTCSACECNLFGSAYCCTEPHCTFKLHKTCFDSPLELHHKSHSHPLRLVTSPPYANAFTCNACFKEGKAFAYNCATCSYDLHINCVSHPEKMTRPDHKHELMLYYSSASTHSRQDVTFFCDVCKNPAHESAWVYYCHECDFGTHLECVASEVKQERVDSYEKRVGDLISDAEQLRIAYLEALIKKQGQEYALDLI